MARLNPKEKESTLLKYMEEDRKPFVILRCHKQVLARKKWRRKLENRLKDQAWHKAYKLRKKNK